MNTRNRTRTLTFKVDALARVEGEGALYLRVRGQQVVEARVDIYEPPRFFEAFLRGRHFSEVPDITARICGICPVAYQMSSAHALEAAFGLQMPPGIRTLRRLLYAGEWLESHALHVYLLHASDFLGYEDAFALGQDHPDRVQQGLELKKIGNEVLQVLGGREVHPINVAVGGFYRLPGRRELQTLRPRLQRALDLAVETTRWVATFEFPDLEIPYLFVALRHDEEYPMNEGWLQVSDGTRLPMAAFEEHFQEEHVPHSNALHCRYHGQTYQVGPLARLNLNADHLTPIARELLEEMPWPLPWRNPFLSIVARSLEMVVAAEEALRVLGTYEEPPAPRVEVHPRAGRGAWITEAPRGILYHRYQVSDDGRIQEARIVPPTSQNLARMEEDLKALAPRVLHLPREQATWRFEQMIRNYDPCISCATHFLRLEVEREEDHG